MRRALLAIMLVLSAWRAHGQKSGPPVLRFAADLIQVDAIVTDRNGNNVGSLKPGNFEVFQDGKRQKIRHFAYKASGREPAARSSVLGLLHLITQGEVRRTMVILIADENISFADFHQVVEALKQYVARDVRPDDQVCILRTSSGSGALDQFTPDKELLRRVLDRMAWRPPLIQPSHVLDGFASAVPAFSVLDTLNRVTAAVTKLEGRKSIILIGPGLPLRDGEWPAESEKLRRMGDSANRAAVTIQAIQARQVNDIVSQDAYRFLADVTAGLFQHGNKDLLGEIERAADDAQDYYLIGWYPGKDAFESTERSGPKYHQVQIKVTDKDLAVRSRGGYFGADRNVGGPTLYTGPPQIQNTLFSPFQKADIDVRLTASFQFDAALGAYVESQVHILPEGIEFHDVAAEPGCMTAGVELLVTPEPLNWSAQTKGLIDGSNGRIEICADAAQRVRQEGFVVVHRRQIGEPGAYQMREAVRNLGESDIPFGGQKALIPRVLVGGPAPIVIGMANQLVDVPDLQREKFALTGIQLWSGETEPEKPTAGFVYRPVRDGDPAVREFHPSDLLKYALFVARGNRGLASEELAVHTQVLCDGEQVFVSGLAQAALGATFSGAYQIPESARAGHCALGVIVSDKGYPGEQWIDFEVKR